MQSKGFNHRYTFGRRTNFSWAVCLIGAAERLKDLGAAGLAWAYLLAWICGAAFYFCLLLLPRVRRQAGYSEGLAT
jgi:hypothetical protein